MRWRDLSVGCLFALLVGACTDINPDRGIAAPTMVASASVDPAVSPQTGGITITLDMQPNSAADVPLVTDGKKLKDFVLDDDVNSATPASKTFTKLKAGTYTIRAAAVAGLSISQINCTSSVTDNNTIDLTTRSVAIQLEGGEAVACTFVGSVPTWSGGEYVTRSQQGWDMTTSWYSDYSTVYASTFGIIEVGVPGSAGYSMQFGGSSDITAYLPAAGTPAALTADYVNPTSTSSGQFGGELLALRLNVDFAAAGFLSGTSTSAFGALNLCSMSDTSLNGVSVTSLLALANTLLGGGSSAYAITDINTIVTELNSAFTSGVPSPYAQQHLVSGSCP